MYWLDNNTGISTAPTPPAVISLTKRFFTNGGLGEQPSIPEDFWFNMIQEELLGVLTMAGVTPVKNDLGQLAKAIQSIAFSAYPVGAPIPWPTAVPPPGFLLMAGQSFSAATYPKLAQAYPSLNLPDMRSRFIRGLDSGKGIDPGRVILSEQGDAVRNITGKFTFVASSKTWSPWLEPQDPNSQGISGQSGVFYSSNSGAAGMRDPTSTAVGAATRANDVINIDISRQVPTANENRPSNTAFLYIVRAA